MTDFNSSLIVAASGLHAQNARMTVIAENLANADSTGKTPTENPYRRQIPTFQSVYDDQLGAEKVAVGNVTYDSSDFQSRYEPGNPAADASGYVKYPNVNPDIESMDMREAQRSYEANLNVISATRQMEGQTLDILKG
ncbi:MAG TPA: flagellar basal body rod protein FlgC [Devosiaceae bacterium]|nr:flagellar basal body rod protein FlgC [Devosiaceae bacterium]